MDLTALVLRIMGDATQFDATIHNAQQKLKGFVSFAVVQPPIKLPPVVFTTPPPFVGPTIPIPAVLGLPSLPPGLHASPGNAAATARAEAMALEHTLLGMLGRVGSAMASLGSQISTGVVRSVKLFWDVFVAALKDIAAGIAVTVTALSGVVSVASSVISTIIQLGMEYQKTATAFEVMTGSAAAGNKLLGDIRKVAVETPYSLRGTREAALELLGFGVAAKDIPVTLARLGDIAAGDQDKLMRLAFAFGRVKEAGRMSAMDLRTFAPMGVGAEQFAQAAGMDVPEFRRKLRESAIGADVMEKTINNLTAATGRFGGMSARQLETAAGRWSNLRDTVESFMERLGAISLDRLGVAGMLKGFTESLGNLDTLMGPILVLFAQLKAAAFDVLGYVRALGEGLGMSFQSPKALIESLTAIVVKLRGILHDWLPTLVTWAQAAADIIMGVSLKVGQAFLKIMQSQTVDAMRNILDHILPGHAFDKDKFRSGLVNLEMDLHRMEDGIGKVDAGFGRVLNNLRNNPLTPAGIFSGVPGQRRPGTDGAVEGLPVHPPDLSADATKYFEGLKDKIEKGVTPLQKFRHEMGLVAEIQKAMLKDLRSGDVAGAAQKLGIAREGVAEGLEKLLPDLTKRMEKGTTPLDEFKTQMGLIGEAEKFVRGDMRGGRLIPSPAAALAALREGRYEAYEKLHKEVGAGGEAKLAPAAMQGSAEAADIINKTIADRRSKEEEILQTLLDANAKAEQRDKDSKIVNDVFNNLATMGFPIVTNQPGDIRG